MWDGRSPVSLTFWFIPLNLTCFLFLLGERLWPPRPGFLRADCLVLVRGLKPSSKVNLVTGLAEMVTFRAVKQHRFQIPKGVSLSPTPLLLRNSKFDSILNFLKLWMFNASKKVQLREVNYLDRIYRSTCLPVDLAADSWLDSYSSSCGLDCTDCIDVLGLWLGAFPWSLPWGVHP